MGQNCRGKASAARPNALVVIPQDQVGHDHFTLPFLGVLASGDGTVVCVHFM
jgi:hypothetical protein